jgi:hypothetical protein
MDELPHLHVAALTAFVHGRDNLDVSADITMEYPAPKPSSGPRLPPRLLGFLDRLPLLRA